MGATATPAKPKAKGALTDKQEQFCLEYLIDFNATQAAIRAGYSPNGANIAGPRLLSNVIIQAKLAELKQARRESTLRTAEDVMKELESMAFSNISDVVEWNESGMVFLKNSDDIPREIAAAIESVQVEEKAVGKEGDGGMVLKTKVKLHPKLQSLIKYGQQAHDMFKDKVEHSMDADLANRLTEALKRSGK